MITNEKEQMEKIKPHILNINSEFIILAIMLAVVGGFLDAYTFVGRGGAFANAQTGNIVLVGVNIFKEDWNEVVLHALPILAFVLGVFASEVIRKLSNGISSANMEHLILVVEIITFSVIGFVPKTISNDVVNVIISFVASLQYCTFKKLGDYPYATTMCTGNLRSASMAAYAAFTQKDYEAFKKAVHYFIVIFSFLFGTFLGGFLTLSIGVHSIWVAVGILLFSLIALYVNEMSKRAVLN